MSDYIKIDRNGMSLVDAATLRRDVRVVVWCCVRLNDLPLARAVSGSKVALCEKCGVAIVYDPRAMPPVPSVKQCMQCAIPSAP